MRRLSLRGFLAATLSAGILTSGCPPALAAEVEAITWLPESKNPALAAGLSLRGPVLAVGTSMGIASLTGYWSGMLPLAAYALGAGAGQAYAGDPARGLAAGGLTTAATFALPWVAILAVETFRFPLGIQSEGRRQPLGNIEIGVPTMFFAAFTTTGLSALDAYSVAEATIPSSRKSPWVAAGLNLVVPVAVATTAGFLSSKAADAQWMPASLMPAQVGFGMGLGAGQVYAGDPVRGLIVGGLSTLAIVAAPFVGMGAFELVRGPLQLQSSRGTNAGISGMSLYLVGLSATAWSMMDAYRVAAEER